MRKFNLNWGVMLAAIVLLGYTYFSFLGMLYIFDGVIWKAILCAIAVIALISACVYVMVTSKVTKIKGVGLVGQILFGVIILAAFLVSGIPFTGFLKVVGSGEKIKSEIANVKQSATGLDIAYNSYAEGRIAEYKDSLSNGNDLKVKSLQRRLLPDSISIVQARRQDWVANIEGMSVWNVKLPHNLKSMQQCAAEWTANYKELADIAYDGQELKPFEYTEFESSLTSLMDSFKKPGYKGWTILIAILSAFVMIIPYLIADTTKTKGGKGVTYDNEVTYL